MIYGPDTLRVARSTHGLQAMRLSGRLTHSPFAGKPFKSELRPWPLARPHEYGSIRVFEIPNEYPIIMSSNQRDRWLADLVTSAKRRIPGINLSVIRMGGPENQLPAELLDADVLLAPEPGPVVARARADGRDGILEIWQDLRIDGCSEGSNSLALTIHGAAQVASFVAFGEQHPDLSQLSDLSLTPIHTRPGGGEE